jgi:hypothetical protein
MAHGKVAGVAVMMAALAASPAGAAEPWSFETGRDRFGEWVSAQATDVSGLYQLSLSCWTNHPFDVSLALTGSVPYGSFAAAPMRIVVDGTAMGPFSTGSMAQVMTVDALEEPDLLTAVPALRDASQLIRVMSGQIDTTFSAEGALEAVGAFMSRCG